MSRIVHGPDNRKALQLIMLLRAKGHRCSGNVTWIVAGYYYYYHVVYTLLWNYEGHFCSFVLFRHEKQKTCSSKFLSKIPSSVRAVSRSTTLSFLFPPFLLLLLFDQTTSLGLESVRSFFLLSSFFLPQVHSVSSSSLFFKRFSPQAMREGQSVTLKL